MRNLFLALLLINLLLWAGFSWFGPEEPPVQHFDGPGITLVREVEAAAESGMRLRERSGVGRTYGGGGIDEFPGDGPGRSGSEADGEADGDAADEAAAGIGDDNDELRDPGSVDGSEIDDPADDRAGPNTEGAGLLAADAAPAAPEQDPQRCLAVGPFVEVADAEAAQALLDEDGLTGVQVRSEEEIWDGYWVYLEGIESNQQASEMLEHLEVNGVEDTQLISRPETGILISLGVYSGLPRAGTRAEQVSRLGYEATVTERVRVTDVIWLEVALDSDQSIEIDPLRPPGRISRLELRACRN